MLIKLSASVLLVVLYGTNVVSALRCQLYSGDKAVIREIEFTSNADFLTTEPAYNATVELLPGFFEDQSSSLVMEHSGSACPANSGEKSTCSVEASKHHPGCARSFYVQDKCKQVISANIDNGPSNSLSFQARQSGKIWLIGAAQTCAIKEYTPAVQNMKTVAFASEGAHIWASARVYLDNAYMGFSKSWQCDYDSDLLPTTPQFQPQENGKVWQIRNIGFQKR